MIQKFYSLFQLKSKKISKAISLINSKSSIFISQSDIFSQVGGVEKYIINEINQVQQNGMNGVHLYSYRKKNKIFRFINNCYYGINLNDRSICKNLSFNELKEFIEVLSEKNLISSINIHHLLRWRNKTRLANFLKRYSIKKIPIFMYLHDNYFICESIFLLKNKKKYCGAAEVRTFDTKECNSCKYGNDRIRRHKKIFKQFFDISTKIIVPSRVILDSLSRYYNKEYNGKTILFEFTSFKFVKNIKKKSFTKKAKIKVAFIGNKLFTKGFYDFLNLIENKKLLDMYEFYVMGPEERNQNITNIRISQRENTIEKIVKNNIDITFLWSLVPESYCYVAYESFAASVPIVTSNISGNICRKINSGDFYGKVFNSISSLSQFLEDKNLVISFLNKNPNSSLLALEHKSFLKQK